jgi:hypothetical protein
MAPKLIPMAVVGWWPCSRAVGMSSSRVTSINKK